VKEQFNWQQVTSGSLMLWVWCRGEWEMWWLDFLHFLINALVSAIMRNRWKGFSSSFTWLVFRCYFDCASVLCSCWLDGLIIFTNCTHRLLCMTCLCWHIDGYSQGTCAVWTSRVSDWLLLYALHSLFSPHRPDSCNCQRIMCCLQWLGQSFCWFVAILSMLIMFLYPEWT